MLKLLDREISPYGYNLTLKAVDMGYPPRTYYKNVHVRLGDLNDHAPVFEKEVYEVQVPEIAPVNTAVARLKVTDDDSGLNARVSLSIAGGNEGGQFRIDPHTGVLFVARELDAETRASYTITVSALDSANVGMRRQSSAKVIISVIDVNDNSPVFEDDASGGLGGTKIVYFHENEPAGSRVTRLQATDADSGDNGLVSYSIANLDLDKLPFEIDTFSGKVTSTKLIDFESEQREYHLLVRASDWGKPYRREAELRLTVKMVDINDNRPQFERVVCVGKIPRSFPNGAHLLTLSALDFDEGSAIGISYRVVSGNSDGCFSLDTSKGTLRLECDLRTLPVNYRTLNVTATDGQHFSDVTTVTMYFVDERSPDSLNGGYYYSNRLFECQETGAAKRWEEIMQAAEKNNVFNREDDVFELASSGAEGLSGLGAYSAFGGNLHRPEFDAGKMPRQIRINESVTPGTIILKVGKNVLTELERKMRKIVPISQI